MIDLDLISPSGNTPNASVGIRDLHHDALMSILARLGAPSPSLSSLRPSDPLMDRFGGVNPEGPGPRPSIPQQAGSLATPASSNLLRILQQTPQRSTTPNVSSPMLEALRDGARLGR